jgi:hypothetical protein
MALPHDLVTWVRVFSTADVSAEPGYETDGIPEPGGLGDSFFLA